MSNKPDNLHIYGIVYGDKQTPFVPFINEGTYKPWRFENNPMIEICRSIPTLDSDDDYYGVVSHKFTEKTGLTAERLYELFNESRQYEKPDVYNLSPDISHWFAPYPNFMQWSEAGHVGITRLIKACCEHCEIVYEENPPQVIFANQFICKVGIYIDYINTVIKPSLELLEGELWHLANKPAGYVAGLQQAELKRLTGLDYYNFVPFVLERMAMQYFHHHKLSIRKLV